MIAMFPCHRVFLTVGTTEFNELIHAVDSRRFVTSLGRIGCMSLVVQIGRGQFPSILAQECETQGILYDCFQFKPSLDEQMAGADLIISHCGAGSILEAVNLRKPLIVVVNDTLQGNHQTELSDALAADGHCLSTTPNNVIEALESIADGKTPIESFTKVFPEADFDAFPGLVDSVFGFEHTD